MRTFRMLSPVVAQVSNYWKPCPAHSLLQQTHDAPISLGPTNYNLVVIRPSKGSRRGGSTVFQKFQGLGKLAGKINEERVLAIEAERSREDADQAAANLADARVQSSWRSHGESLVGWRHRPN